MGPDRQALLPVVELFGPDGGIGSDLLSTRELDTPIAGAVAGERDLVAIGDDVGKTVGVGLAGTGGEEDAHPHVGDAHDRGDGAGRLRGGGGGALGGETAVGEGEGPRIEAVGIADAVVFGAACEAEGAVADGADLAGAAAFFGGFAAVDLYVQFALKSGEGDAVVFSFADGIWNVAREVELLADDLRESRQIGWWGSSVT